MSDPSNTDHPSQPAGSESCALDRREAIKTFLGIGLVAGLEGCVGRRGPPAGAPDAANDPAAADPAVAPEAALSEPGVAAAEPVRAAPASEHDHPADGPTRSSRSSAGDPRQDTWVENPLSPFSSAIHPGAGDQDGGAVSLLVTHWGLWGSMDTLSVNT